MTEFNDKLKAAQAAFQDVMAEQEQAQEDWWDSLTEDQQIDAFCAVARRIHKGDVVDQGSYRYVLYDVCGFGPQAYVAAQCAGYLDIHNLIFQGLEAEKTSLTAAVELIQFIASDRHELSDDKVAWQRDDWKQRCRKFIDALDSVDEDRKTIDEWTNKKGDTDGF